MNWHSWSDFVAMGGYGLYVWGSVWVVLASLAFEVLGLIHRRQVILRALRATSRGDA
jgi:heme exporter protein D